MPEDTQRPSPDALLALAKRQGRGRLKIFFGASPGVGKTYAMLVAARAEKVAGRNVLVGIVETHGRAETEALLEGLEVLPRKPTLYVNRIMSEFDIDAALARRPVLLLLDECAHTNIPGSRHPKRWQDIEELLGAGIDVWTTLNVQHLEGLNDVVQKITRVRVRETVPDSVFEQADEIVLIDLPSDELIRRLAEGKVYFKNAAARARESFFKPQNLDALRELALRRAAERVDTDLVQRMQAEAIEGPLPAGERILACVGPSAEAARIVRTAKRLADLMDAPWIAVFVERANSRMSDARRRQVDAALKLAEGLGAETRTLVGNDLSAEILRFARYENVTQIVVGRWRRGWIGEFMRRSLPHELVRRAEGIGIHFVTGSGDASAGPRAIARDAAPIALDPMAIMWATLGVAAAFALGLGLTVLTSIPNLSMIFLLSVLFAAVAFGIWPAVYASLLSFLVMNFFFIEPLYTFTIAEPHELLSLIIFLVVSMISATLAGRVRAQVQLGAQRVRALRRLYEFTRRLSSQPTIDTVADAAASEMNGSLSRPAAVLLAQGSEIVLRASWPPIDELDASAMAAARWAFSRDEAAGAETATLPLIAWRFLPIRSPHGPLGVVGIMRANADDRFEGAETLALLETITEQAAAALDRAILARDMIAVRSTAETERVRNTLLSSVSHDFRTPLSSILGSATSLLDYGDRLSTDARKALLVQVKDEAELLDEMVRNLLAVTRIDAGALELRKDWIDIQEVVHRVASAIRRRHHATNIEIDLPRQLPLLRADPTLCEQALTNILMNAVTHNPSETRVRVGARVSSTHVDVHITDHGRGIPAELMPRLFDRFSRADRPEQVQGAGLGLAIAKGIMDAHGGTISVESPVEQGRGTRFVLTFPREDSSR